MTPAAAIGIRIDVVMLELCTATVMRSPTNMATKPARDPGSAFIDRSTRSATNAFMFLVMKISESVPRPGR